MRLLDVLKTAGRSSRDSAELGRLLDRLRRHSGTVGERREALIERVLADTFPPDRTAEHWLQLGDVVRQLLRALLAYDGLFAPAAMISIGELSTVQTWEAMRETRRLLSALEDPQVEERIFQTLGQIVANILPEHLPPRGEDGLQSLTAPLIAMLPNPAGAVEGAIGSVINTTAALSPFPNLWQKLELNALLASGINPNRPSSKQVVTPTKAKKKGGLELVEDYLANTPFSEYFQTSIPFSIPFSARFEHMHIVGGSGHGKTQLLQSFILRDIEQLHKGRGSIVVIDSQGDMIRTILGLAELSNMTDRVVLIDPNDIENPPCLNLFDFGLDRLEGYDPVEREKLVNGAIALYEYMFGALLGAELTQRQGVIFRYLARLLMVVPGATIHTLREFMENPETTRPHLHKLDPVSRLFFETQFFASVYDDTRQQILTRLWGVISNSVLARMFSHPRNAVDLFSALNRGSLVLINTAKDLLKQDGCELFGRFFISLLAQAVQERSAIPEDRRRSTFVYIDEAQDYFDEAVENLLNQARKYRVGLVLAHQNLGQFGDRLAAAVMASTAIKLAGGVSARDAGTLARDMRCEPDNLLAMRKHRVSTDFACFIKNVTPQPVALTVPFGQMEGRPRMSEAEHETLIEKNRQRVASGDPQQAVRSRISIPSAGEEIAAPELL